MSSESPSALQQQENSELQTKSGIKQQEFLNLACKGQRRLGT